jgi:hypothetical protein
VLSTLARGNTGQSQQGHHEDPHTRGCCPNVLQEANKGSSPLHFVQDLWQT